MKIRKFRAGDTVVDTSDSADKAAGLAASNAELERGDRKPSGFLGLGRLFQGNIDEKGSEAYEQYGAGYGRKVEAENDRLKAATLKDAAADEKRRSDEARAAEDARSEARIEAANKKIAAIKEREAAAESDYRGPMERRKLDVSEPAKAPAASTGSTSGSDYRGPMQRMKLDVSKPASGSGGGRGPTYEQVDANNRKGFTASPTSTDPAQRAAAAAARSAAAAKAAADAPKVRNPETDEGEDVKPASQAQLKALAAIARATGNSSGSISNRQVPTAAEAARKIAEYAKKAGNTVSRITDSFKKEKYKAKGGAIQSYAKGGAVSASRRGDGIAQRGKTRGKMC